MAQDNFARALDAVLRHEGGYVNHPKDPGGATNLGVTLATARRLGIDVDGDGDTDIIDMKLLKPTDAAKVYKYEYWDKVRGDDLPRGLDYAVFDFAVNSGVSRAAIYLQEIVDVAPDGKIGPITLKAVNAGARLSIINRLCDDRLAFLGRLSTFKTFGNGWTARVAGVRSEAMQMAAAPVPPQPEIDHSPAEPVTDPIRQHLKIIRAELDALEAAL